MNFIAQDPGVGGMACGTEQDSNLLDGNFNEGESHKSFLEALQEWRNANRGEDDVSVQKGTAGEYS